MAEVYIFSPDAEDLTTFGLVGALEPISCDFEEQANGNSEITMEHPIDEPWGKFAAIREGCLLVCEVPVRMTPEINGTKFVTAVQKAKVKSTADKTQRTVFSLPEKGKKLKVMDMGVSVNVVAKPASGSRLKIKYSAKKKTVTGWIDSAAVELGVVQQIPDNAQGIEEVAPSWTVAAQIFRIHEVVKGINTIKVSARHISYDLMGNLTFYSGTDTTKLDSALKGILEKTAVPHDFSIRTNMADERAGMDFFGKNPISALLDPDSGVLAAYGACLVRDNFEFTVLQDPGVNRGVIIEYGKNLTGITYTESTEDMCLAVIPVGTDKKGNRLFLDAKTYASKPDTRALKVGGVTYYAVVSERFDSVPYPKVAFLEVSDAKEGKGVNLELARTRLYKAAQEALSGADTPSIEAKVEFVNLGDTAEYSALHDLEKLFLWDYATVRHGVMGIDDTTRVVSIVWDVLTERMKTMELGQVGITLANTGISSWQVPTGVSGSKLAYGSLPSGALAEDIIAARHLQAESVGVEQLAAGSVVAEKIAAGAVTADKLEAGAISAGSIEAITAKLQSLTADDIATDTFAAAIANLGILTAGDADIRRAVVETLIASALTVTDAVGEKVFIDNLTLNNVQAVSATVGTLVVKASDGKFYRLDFDGAGSLVPVEVTVTDGEATAGVTSDGTRRIIESALTVEELGASSMKAVTAIINKLTADQIDVGTLFANEAYITKLATSEIYGGKSISMVVDGMTTLDGDFRRVVRIDDDGLHVGDNQASGEVLIDSESVNVVMNGVQYSKFGANYVQFGKYQLRKSADGGLVFKLKGGDD